jgi:ribonuclease D
MDKTYQFVNDDAKWQPVIAHLRSAGEIAFDLEADSMFHFQEKICLLQIATRTRTVVADPLALTDFSPLAEILQDPGIRKVFHGADYDIRSLYRDFGISVNNLFDTEMACRFLGLRESGLEAALRNFLSIQLDKRFQRKDWSQRPLPQPMQDYAASDVHFLLPLADLLTARLEEKNRLSWVIEECGHLSCVRPPQPPEGPMFLHCKGAGKLDRRGLAVLEELLQLRSIIAAQKDKPVFKIIGTRSLLTIAARRPDTRERLADTAALSPRQQQMYGDEVLQCVRKAMRWPDDRLPMYPRKRTRRLPESVSARIQALKQWREKRANDLEIDPGLIFNKAMTVQLAEAVPADLASLAKIEGIRNWQIEAFGAEIVQILATAS